MSRRWAELALWSVLIATGCVHSAASPAVPVPPRYTAAEIGAMFARPRTNMELLRNIKLATDQDLIFEPGFTTETYSSINGLNGKPVINIDPTMLANMLGREQLGRPNDQFR
jgi:hypothetical protein